MIPLARYVHHGQTGILVATATAGVLLPSIGGASGFLLQPNININSGIRCRGAGQCAEDALIKPRSCGRGDIRICMASATERLAAPALDGLEQDHGNPTSEATSGTRHEKYPESSTHRTLPHAKRDCESVLIAHPRHRACDETGPARAELGDPGEVDTGLVFEVTN